MAHLGSNNILNQKQMKARLLPIALGCLATFVLTSCDDNDDPEPNPTPEPVSTTGVYILCAGNYGGNNSTLDFYDPATETLSQKVFASANGRAIGDNANSMLIHGDKMYIAVNNSATVEVSDLTGKSLKTIALANESGVPQNPRELAAAGDKVYVTLYDGYVARIDTESLEVDAKVQVGANPEGICECGGKLYVANSGGYNPVPDNTLSVIDINTFTVTSTIEVVANPVSVQKDSQGALYVLSYGNYSDIPNTLQRIDLATGTSSTIATNDYIINSVCNDKVYIYTAKQENWVVTESDIKVYDTTSATLLDGSFITDGTPIANVYTLTSDPVTENLYVGISDYTNTGDMLIFSPEGKLAKKLALSGLNPRGAYFVTE